MTENREIFTLLEEKIKKDHTLSDIEWMLCTEAQKETYVRFRAKNNYSLSDVIEKWCSKELMDELLAIYIAGFCTLRDSLMDRCPEKLRVKYFQQIMCDESDRIFEYNLNYCPDYLKSDLIDSVVKRGDSFKYGEFETFSLSQKLNHIIIFGLINLDKDFNNWYDNWKTAKGRDFKIDSIFEEL